MKQIISPKNPDFNHFLSLTTAKGIKKHGQFIVSGQKLVKEVLQLSSLNPKILIYSEAYNGPTFTEMSQAIMLSKKLFRELDLFGTNSPLLLATCPPTKPFKPNCTGLNIYLALSDPGNLGASIRSATAFGAQQIILLKEACHRFHPKVTRAAAGTNIFANITQGPSINDLTEQLILLDMKGQAIENFNWPKDCNLLVGEEGQGIPENINGQALAIPMDQTVESLNAMASLSIALYCYKISTNQKV